LIDAEAQLQGAVKDFGEKNSIGSDGSASMEGG